MKKSFTLLELLIVIAIIGILVTLLMPSLNKARDKAKLVVCLSNTKQITNANMTHHKMFGRLVKNGYLNGGDLTDQTFTYNDGGTKRVVPFTAAIAEITNAGVDFSSHSNLETYISDLNNLPIFKCPGKEDEYLQGFVSSYGGKYIRGRTAYVGSDAAMGIENSKPRANGLVSLFEDPDKVFLHMDGARRTVGRSWFAIYNNQKELTMSDALNGNQAGHSSNFAQKRHNGRTAFTFADGHSKAILTISHSLKEVYLSKGIFFN